MKHSPKQLTQKLLRDELFCSNPREGGLPDPAIQQTNDEAFLDRRGCSLFVNRYVATAGRDKRFSRDKIKRARVSLSTPISSTVSPATS